MWLYVLGIIIPLLIIVVIIIMKKLKLKKDGTVGIKPNFPHVSSKSVKTKTNTIKSESTSNVTNLLYSLSQEDLQFIGSIIGRAIAAELIKIFPQKNIYTQEKTCANMTIDNSIIDIGSLPTNDIERKFEELTTEEEKEDTEILLNKEKLAQLKGK